MSKTASDKLAKLAEFGKLAGEAPAAAAREAMSAATTAIEPAQEKENSTQSPPSSPIIPEKSLGAATAVKVLPPQVASEANLTRNVVFLPADQIELDRLEDILRLGGVRKPTLADLVRVALRSANPTPNEAAELFRVAKALDARRKKE